MGAPGQKISLKNPLFPQLPGLGFNSNLIKPFTTFRKVKILFKKHPPKIRKPFWDLNIFPLYIRIAYISLKLVPNYII